MEECAKSLRENGEPNSRQLEPGGRLVASFGEAPASRVSPRDGHYDVHYRPTHRARMAERLFLSSGKKEFWFLLTKV
jgi:hypothetical protein